MKRIIIVIFSLVTVAAIWSYYTWFKIPFATESVENGRTSFSNDNFSFEFPGILTNVEHGKYFRDTEIGTLTNGNYDFFYNYKGTVSGMPSIEEITRHGSYLMTVNYHNIIRDSLALLYPNHNRVFYDSIIRSKLKVITTITQDKEKYKYMYKTAVGKDTILIPVLIDSVGLSWLNNHNFTHDTIDGCYRKIFIDKVEPTKYAGCYLRKIDNGKIHSVFVIEKVNRMVKLSDEILSKDSIRSILYSIRLTESNQK